MRFIIDLQSCQNGSRHRGIGRYSMAMTRALARQGDGHEFYIVLSDAFPGTIADVRRELEGYVPQERIITCSLPGDTSSAALQNAWRTRAAQLARAAFIDDLEPDLLFIPSLFEGFWDRTVVSVEKASYPTVVTLYDLIPLDAPLRYLPLSSDRADYFRKLEDLRRADLLLAISDYVRREAIDRLGISPDHVVTTLLGVDEELVALSKADVDRNALMQRHGISRPFVLNTSPLEHRKNVEGLIAGFASMDRAIIDSHQLVIIGRMNAPGRRYVAELAAAEGLAEDAVVLTGYVSDADLAVLYAQCELFAFPSLSEGFGLPVLEAMACGAPAIGSSTTSIPEVIGRSDLMFDPTSARGIGEVMQSILADPIRREAARNHSIAKAAEFGWGKAAAIALREFERLVEQRTTRGTPPAGEDDRSEERRKLALVTATMAPHHRLTGVVATLVSTLAATWNIVLICPEGAVADEWIGALCEVHGLDWLDRHAGEFDRILYATGTDAIHRFAETMADHPGVLLLTDSFSPPVATVATQTALAAMIAVRGYGGLIDRSTPAPIAEWFSRLAASTVRERWDAATQEVALAGIPIHRSAFAAAGFRAERGIGADDVVVAAFVADVPSAAAVIAEFRSGAWSTVASSRLVLYRFDRRANDAVSLGWGFGNVYEIAALDPLYLGIMSAADRSVLRGELSPGVVARITADASACGHTLEAADEHDRDRDDEAMHLPSPLAGAGRDALDRILVLDAPRRRGVSRGSPIDRMPRAVRGVAPNGRDIADLAVAIARNEGLRRPAGMFLDVSSFASAGRTRRLDPLARSLLLDILRRGGPAVQPVYGDSAEFVTASNFMHNLLGVAAPPLSDTPIAMRAGDRLIGVDVLSSFAPPEYEALRQAAERGVAINYVVVGARLIGYPELTERAADFVVAAGRRPPSMMSRIAPVEAVGVRVPAASPSRGAETVERLLAEGIPLGVSCAAGQRLLLDQRFVAGGDAKGRYHRIDPLPFSADEEQADTVLRQAEPGKDGSRRAIVPADLRYAVVGHILGSYSLAIVNRTIARTLEQGYPGQVRYLPYETVPIDHTEGVPGDEKEQMIEFSRRAPPSVSEEIALVHHYPIMPPPGDFRLALAMFFWEESLVPAKTVGQLERWFDAVVSPARSVTNALIDSGLRLPIATIGTAVDVAPFTAIAGGRRVVAAGNVRTFLHVSSCFKRKGIDVLLAAWASAFDDADAVRLVIKTFPNPHNDVEDQLAALRGRFPRLAPVVIINRDVDREEMVTLYAEADVMVQPSRGEGYNMPALEAMAAGLPLIVTGFGGHRDFCGPDEARLLRYRLAPSGSHVGGAHSMWVEPDLDDLVAALRECVDPVYANTIEARRQHALRAAAAEGDEQAWLRRYAGTVSTLLDTPVGGTPRIAWVSTWNVQCGIAQYSNYLLDSMAADYRENTVVLCDERTVPDRSAAIRFDPVWIAGQAPKADALAAAAGRHDVEAVVIQHQDGLISWNELGRIGHHPGLTDRTVVAILHNARNLRRVGDDELPQIISGLSRMAKVLVHNIGDVNFLLERGLVHNVGLLPHGAVLPPRAPWPRALAADDAPIIGCHGFFFRHKGIDQLIRAAAVLRREWPNLRLRLVNARFPGGEHDAIIDECRALAAELGMQNAIEWHLDFLSTARIDELLGGCDVVVLPYAESDDSASGAVRVAMSSMVPFVATRVKIFAELNDAVAWAKSNDPADLVEEIAPLLRSPAARRDVQARMHEWLSAHEWTSVSRTLAGLIEGLVKEKRLGWGRSR